MTIKNFCFCLLVFTLIFHCKGTNINTPVQVIVEEKVIPNYNLNHIESINNKTLQGEIENNFDDFTENEKSFSTESELILEANKNILSHLVDGDIKPRLFRSTSGRRWPKESNGENRGKAVIAYSLSSQYSQIEQKLLTEAMRDIEKHTCIRFVSKPNSRRRIAILNGQGCYAELGYTGRRVHEVSLGIPGCMSRGTAIHELLHVLGFDHEHQRPDRNEYLRLVWENLSLVGLLSSSLNSKPGIRTQTIYDYGSVLHYNKFSLSSPSFTSSLQVYPVNGVTPSIGQRNRLSPYDVEKIRSFYQCDPSSFERCGRNFFRQTRGAFQSPNFPSLYQHDTHCTWGITVRRGSFIQIRFSNVSIEDSKFCMYDAILVHDGINAAAPVLRRICGTHSNITIKSTGNRMFVIFSTDRSKVKNGFRADFRQVRRAGKKPRTQIGLESPPPLKNVRKTFNCSFEIGFCGLKQDKTNEINFILFDLNTSAGQGIRIKPNENKGKYIFLEWKYPALQGDMAIIRTPWFKNGNFCITFDKQLSGRYVGGLRLYAYSQSRSSNLAFVQTKWEEFGNQGNKWKTVEINYVNDSPAQFVHFYLKGIKYRHHSIIAIDNWKIFPGKCSENLSQNEDGRTSTTPRSTRVRSQPRNSRNLYPGMTLCTFERRSSFRSRNISPRRIPGNWWRDLGDYRFPRHVSNSLMCGWSQESSSDDFDWTRKIGPTPSKDTGPFIDTTTGRGHYLYTEASRKRENEVAMLKSYAVLPSDYCFDFNFHMNGKNMGKLKLKTIQTLANGTKHKSLFFEVEGNQGSSWKNVEVDFTPLKNVKNIVFRFEGIIGNSSLSDIALDDVAIIPGKCDACRSSTQVYSPNTGRPQKFASGCLHSGLFWFRCCSLSPYKFIVRRVRQCRENMFSLLRLNWYCRNL